MDIFTSAFACTLDAIDELRKVRPHLARAMETSINAIGRKTPDEIRREDWFALGFMQGEASTLVAEARGYNPR